MGAGHGHGPEHEHELTAGPAVRRTLTVLIVPMLIATVVGLIVLWPRGAAPEQPASNVVRLQGEVIAATPPCPSETPAQPGGDCGTATVRVGDEELPATVPSGPSAPQVAVGDRVVLMSSGSGETASYAVVDHDRGTALLLLMAVFAAAVIAFARWRGLASLVGLAVTFALLIAFLLPAIQRGEPPLLVAVVAAAAIMFAVLYLTHGITVSTSVAVLGTLSALVLTGLLGLLVTNVMRLTGAGTDEAAVLTNVLAGIDLRGLLLAGIIIGSLGVLDDVTITQTAIVGELSEADPTMRARDLYRAANRVGRAHVASVVNTIILAYAGASLPLLLLLVTGGGGASNVLTTQAISIEIVRGVVGTLGLIAAVPITTALAAWVAARRPIAHDASGAAGGGPRDGGTAGGGAVSGKAQPTEPG